MVEEKIYLMETESRFLRVSNKDREVMFMGYQDSRWIIHFCEENLVFLIKDEGIEGMYKGEITIHGDDPLECNLDEVIDYFKWNEDKKMVKLFSIKKDKQSVNQDMLMESVKTTFTECTVC